MKYEFDSEKIVAQFNSLSARRRWFLIGIALTTVTVLLDMLPGYLPFAVGFVALFGLVTGLVLSMLMIADKVYDDLYSRK